MPPINPNGAQAGAQYNDYLLGAFANVPGFAGLQSINGQAMMTVKNPNGGAPILVPYASNDVSGLPGFNPNAQPINRANTTQQGNAQQQFPGSYGSGFGSGISQPGGNYNPAFGFNPFSGGGGGGGGGGFGVPSPGAFFGSTTANNPGGPGRFGQYLQQQMGFGGGGGGFGFPGQSPTGFGGGQQTQYNPFAVQGGAFNNFNNNVLSGGGDTSFDFSGRSSQNPFNPFAGGGQGGNVGGGRDVSRFDNPDIYGGGGPSGQQNPNFIYSPGQAGFFNGNPPQTFPQQGQQQQQQGGGAQPTAIAQTLGPNAAQPDNLRSLTAVGGAPDSQFGDPINGDSRGQFPGLSSGTFLSNPQGEAIGALPNAEDPQLQQARADQFRQGGYTQQTADMFKQFGLNPDGSDPNQGQSGPIAEGPIGGQSGNSRIVQGNDGLVLSPDSRHQNIFTAPPGTFPTNVLQALNNGELKLGSRVGPVDLTGQMQSLIDRNDFQSSSRSLASSAVQSGDEASPLQLQAIAQQQAPDPNAAPNAATPDGGLRTLAQQAGDPQVSNQFVSGGIAPGQRDPIAGGPVTPVQQPDGSVIYVGPQSPGFDPNNTQGGLGQAPGANPALQGALPGQQPGVTQSINDPFAAGRGFNTGDNPLFEAQNNQFGGLFLDAQAPGRAGNPADFRGNVFNQAAGIFGNDPFELFGEAAAIGTALNTSSQLGNQQNARLNLAQQQREMAANALRQSALGGAFENSFRDILSDPTPGASEADEQAALAAARRRLQQGGQAAAQSLQGQQAASGLAGGESAGLAGGLQNQLSRNTADAEQQIRSSFGAQRAGMRAQNLQSLAGSTDAFQQTQLRPTQLITELQEQRGFNTPSGTAALIEGLYQAEGFKQSKEAGFALQGGVFDDIVAGTSAVGSLLQGIGSMGG